MKQYLIVERDYNESYAYIESETMFKLHSQQRIAAGRRYQADLDRECALDQYPNGTYFVFELKEQKNVKTQKKPQRKSNQGERKVKAKKPRQAKAKSKIRA